MASFTKACVEWSNNLKNLWTPKPSSSPQFLPSPSTMPLQTFQPHCMNHQSTYGATDREDVHEMYHPARHRATKATQRKKAAPPPIPSRTCKLNGSATTPTGIVLPVSECIHRKISTECQCDNDQVRQHESRVHKSNAVMQSEPSAVFPIRACQMEFEIPRVNYVKTHHKSNSMPDGCFVRAESPVSAAYRKTVDVIESERERNPVKLSPSSPTLAHRIAQLTRNSQLDTHMDIDYPFARGRRGKVYNSYNSASSSPIFPHRGTTIAAIKQKLLSQGMKIDVSAPTRQRFRNYMRRVVRGRPVTVSDLWKDDQIMAEVLKHLPGSQLFLSCVVCKCWLRVIYHHGFWGKLTMNLDFNRWRVRARSEDMSRKMYKRNISSKSSLMSEDMGAELREMIDSGIRKQIRSLTLLHLADCYVSTLCKTLVEIRENISHPVHINNSIVPANRKPWSAGKQHSMQRSVTVHVRPPSTYETLKRIQTECVRPTDENFQIFQSSSFPNQKTSTLPVPVTNYGQWPKQGEKLKINAQFNSPISAVNQGNSRTNTMSSAPTFFSKLILRHCSLTDNSLQLLVHTFPELRSLELECCNRLSESAFWNCLPNTIVELSVFDCVNVTDESVSAVAQRLPDLKYFTLQAYHVTDSAFIYFDQRKQTTMRTMKLTQCMELTSQGVANLSFALPHLQALSISGCANVMDEGLGALSQQFQRLVELDLSWCKKITDNALMFVSSYQVGLKKLVLDRCVALTDLGIGYLTTISGLQYLSLRWCNKLSDATASHVLEMTSLTFLSLAGCKRITEEGFCTLGRHPCLKQLELTHCPAASKQVIAHLKENLNNIHLWN